jgi:Na+/phosphate symporter
VGSRHSSSQSINFVVNLVKLENIANLSSGSFKKAISDRSKHISSSFDTAVYGLENDVLMMSSLPDRIFQTAIEALFNRDSELCDHVIAEDEEIDILEKQVEGNRPRLGRAALPDIFRFNASWRGICGWRLRPSVDL